MLPHRASKTRPIGGRFLDARRANIGLMKSYRSPIGAVLAGALLILGAIPALGVVMPPPIFPAPNALHYTTNVETCKANGGTEAYCASLATHGAVAFYASWQCGGCTAKGFKLKSPGSAAAFEDSNRLLFVKMPPAGGWTGQCYVVVAYHDALPSTPANGAIRASAQPPATTYEESLPSAQACVTATTTNITITVSAEREYSRTYSILYSNNQQQIQDGYNHTSDPMETGDRFIVQDSFSQTNTFYRSAYSFNRAPLGDATVFGGSFAFDGQACSDLYSPAPNGWASATWIKPIYGTVVQSKWTKNSTGATEIVDDLIHAWHPGKTLTFFLEPTETPETDQSGLVPPSFTCVGMVSNARLIVTVGITK